MNLKEIYKLPIIKDLITGTTLGIKDAFKEISNSDDPEYWKQLAHTYIDKVFQKINGTNNQ